MKNAFLKLCCTILCTCISLISKAQLTDQVSAYRNINRSNYIRLLYDNDLFTGTDRYYSQGITAEYVSPAIKRFFLSRLLWKPYKTTAQYGIGLNLTAYTPTSILSDKILYGDRPYHADISLQTFLINTDPVHHQQISTGFSIGVMGPLALGKEIQKGIHHLSNDAQPQGWQFQTKNDIILNYQLNYEKQLIAAANNFLLSSTAEARAGTLNDKLTAGVNIMAGTFNKRFTPVNAENKKAECFFFSSNKINVVGYDASLQGGIFNRNNPYIISTGDINRISFRSDLGIAINFKKINLSYAQSFLTKEFKTGRSHKWGGLSIGVAF